MSEKADFIIRYIVWKGKENIFHGTLGASFGNKKVKKILKQVRTIV